jgi:hypothetical protein
MRDEAGVWTLELNEADQAAIERSHPSYLDALPRYLTALDAAFQRAREKSEFNFLLSIFAIRGMQDAGWDPYETTVKAIDAIRRIHSSEIDVEANEHLRLWLYGHIMEASEPYDALLLQVAEHGEEVARLRIAARAEHAHEALGRRPGGAAERLEADRGVDVVAQHGLPGLEVALEHGLPEISRQRHLNIGLRCPTTRPGWSEVWPHKSFGPTFTQT